jgi:hypothetical protein
MVCRNNYKARTPRARRIAQTSPDTTLIKPIATDDGKTS